LSREYGKVLFLDKEMTQGDVNQMVQFFRAHDLFIDAISPEGLMQVPNERLFDYMMDPYKYMAARHGISREAYVEWVDHYNEPLCKATTKKGRRCRSMSYIPMDPVKYFEEGDRVKYCVQHYKMYGRS